MKVNIRPGLISVTLDVPAKGKQEWGWHCPTALAAALWTKNKSNESHKMATEACTSSSISVRGMNISLITPSAVSQHVAGAWHPPARESFCLFRFSLILLFSFILRPPPLQTTSVQEAIATHWPTNSKQRKSEALGWGIVPCCHALLLPGL